MTHDWSHLDEHAYDALQETYEIDGDILSNKRECAAAVRNAVLGHLTPSDLAALLAEKCQGWVAVPVEPTEAMLKAAPAMRGGVPNADILRREMARGHYSNMLASSPKIGDE